MTSNILSQTATPVTLVLPSPIPSTCTTRPTIRTPVSVGVLLGVLVSLWAVCTITIGIALVLGPNAGTALSMAGTGSTVGVLLGVLMSLWAVCDIRLPAITVGNLVSGVLNWRAPVEIFQRSIHRIVIFMERLRSGRSRTDETLKHKSVDPHLLGPAIPIQGAGRVATSLCPTGHDLLQNATPEDSRRIPPSTYDPVLGPNTALIGHFVVGVVEHRKPSFITNHIATITSIAREAQRCQ